MASGLEDLLLVEQLEFYLQQMFVIKHSFTVSQFQ